MSGDRPWISGPPRGEASGGPIVVLESTVIAQGLPWPENLEMAAAMEGAVLAAGARPATVGVLDGRARIGLDGVDLERLARPAGDDPRAEGKDREGLDGRRIRKANRRDLSAVLAAGGSAATTVSATLWLARRYGLDPCVMATGGLGGVHRGAGISFDVSTDLDELARADGCLVVCSGFKSILDIPATLEAMETRGIAIVGYRTDELPAFTTASSGLPLEHRVESPEQAARIVWMHRRMCVPGAVVLVQPVPEEDAIDREEMEQVLTEALAEATRAGITGKAITPFLLGRISQGTAGKSLRANMSLLVSNARLAGEIAVALSAGS
ncbi:Pseudouridine-5'-phosphate glycosidase [Aquisphaera giovannonii]|uniref:Pseudouridine-5'-phosphate glycosidase n=2 Tax=Aquisphaera giovannonii TaxID=406548 RepID=A0A5B9VYF0_9BACT|nr:Pseudouridine-5'-phosphate glycosidase [Aquisphaera giovannonii]